MNKKLLLFFTLAFLLASCGGSGGDADISDDPDFKVGTQGVTLAFVQDSPPSRIFAGEEYTISLEVRNVGAFPEAFPRERSDLAVDLFFTGYDRELLGLPDHDRVDVDGSKTQTNPEGGLAFYDEEFDVRLYDDSDALPQDIRVTACYEYETRAALETCVDPNPTRNEDDTCQPGTFSVGGGQAGPIAVTSVQQTSLKGRAQFVIEISNVGPGGVFKGRDCINPPLGDRNFVELADVFLGDDRLDCSPSDQIRLVNGRGIITCKADRLDEDQPSYLSSLGVHIAYNYKQSISKRVTIERIE